MEKLIPFLFALKNTVLSVKFDRLDDDEITCTIETNDYTCEGKASTAEEALNEAYDSFVSVDNEVFEESKSNEG